MLDISMNNIITMTRGDDVIIPLNIFYGSDDGLTNDRDIPNVNDKIFFAVMEPNQRFENAILKKVMTYSDIDSSGTVNIHLIGLDTEYLHEGKYKYCVKLLRKDPFTETEDNEGRTKTIITDTAFYII